MKSFITLCLAIFLPLIASADFLSYQGKLRNETDAAIIANLKRKGWVDAPKPDFDASTYTAEWKDGSWVVRALTADEITAARKALFPDVEVWKIKVWLGRNGTDPDTVPAMLDQLFANNEAAKIEAKTRWTSVPKCPRDHPLVSLLGGHLGLTSAQIDAAWPQILAIE